MMHNTWLKLLISTVIVGGVARSATASGDANVPQTSVVKEGPVAVTVTVSRSTARVADPIELSIDIDAPAGTNVELPQLGERVGDFHVRSATQLRDIPSGEATGARRFVLKAKVETLKTGDLELPSFIVKYGSANGKGTLDSLSTKPIKLHIASVLEGRADPAKFHDIKGTVDLPIAAPTSYAWVAWAGGGVGTAVAAAAVFLIARRRRAITPAAWALATIKELESAEVGDAAQAAEVINRLTDVVRDYFELQCGLETTAATSREFLDAASHEYALSAVARENLAALVALADHVKFARYQVSDHAVAKAIQKARTLIQECESIPQSTAKGAA